MFSGEDADGFSLTDVDRLKAESPQEGMHGVSPRFVINSISNAIIRSDAESLTSRKDFYNRWVKEDVHRALFASFEEEVQQLLDKYLDEVRHRSD